VERTGLWEYGKRVAWLDEDDFEDQMEEMNRLEEEKRKEENLKELNRKWEQ